MRRVWWALRIFFATLFSRTMAAQVRRLLSGERLAEAAPPPKPEKPKPAAPKPPPRSEALTLLAALQREARFVDFVKEPLEGYSDAEIGAVAREVHRGCGLVLERLFAIRPATEEAEGSEIEVPDGFDAFRYRLVGEVSGSAPFRGRLTHPGWEATRCELPGWSGNPASARIIAPIEVQL